MTGKTQAWGAALLAVAALLLIVSLHWPSALIGAALGWLLGARQEWVWERLKGLWAALSALCAAWLAPKQPARPARVQSFFAAPPEKPAFNLMAWLRDAGNLIKLGLGIALLAIVLMVASNLFGFFRNAGCAVRSLTFWPCETRESLRAERDAAQLRGRISEERADVNREVGEITERVVTRERIVYVERERALDAVEAAPDAAHRFDAWHSGVVCLRDPQGCRLRSPGA